MDVDELEDVFMLINSQLKTNYNLSLNVEVFNCTQYYLSINVVDFQTESTKILSFFDKKRQGNICFEGWGPTLNKAFKSLLKEIDVELPNVKKVLGIKNAPRFSKTRKS
jgi:hypothetical protein